MLVQLQCPQCGAPMEVDDQQEQVFCSFCGTRIANLKEKLEVTQNVNVSGTVRHVMDRSNEPNLYISYATANSSVVMVVRIVDTGTKNTYFNGQTQTYHLSQGRHDIVLKIGRKNYDRTIFIPADNTPVRINAAYNGRNAEITIDQPNYTYVANADGSYSVQQIQQTVAEKKKPQSVFGIIAFVLSLTAYGAVIGVPLAIVDFIRMKKDKEHSHGLAIAGFIIGTVMLLVLVPGWLGLWKDTPSDSGSPSVTQTISRSNTDPTDDPNGGKKEKKGFNTNTNRSYQIGDYTIQIPNYFYEREKTNGLIKVATAQKNADAYLVFSYEYVGASQAEYDAKKDEISAAIINTLDNAKTTSKESVRISGYSGTLLNGSCSVEGFDASFMVAHAYDYARENIVYFLFVQKTEGKFDYASDAKKIIISLKTASSVTTTPSPTTHTGIRPQFQKAMEGYLNFFKEYCKFIKKYASSPDASMLTQYYSMLNQYARAMEELDAIDESELSQEELKLYLDTMNEINKMLIGLAGT